MFRRRSLRRATAIRRSRFPGATSPRATVCFSPSPTARPGRTCSRSRWVEQRDRVHAVQRSERRGRLASPGREPGRHPVQRRLFAVVIIAELSLTSVSPTSGCGERQRSDAHAFREQLRRGRQSAFHLPLRHDRVEPEPDHGSVEQRDRIHAVQRSERRGRLASPGREPGRDPFQRRAVHGDVGCPDHCVSRDLPAAATIVRFDPSRLYRLRHGGECGRELRCAERGFAHRVDIIDRPRDFRS